MRVIAFDQSSNKTGYCLSEDGRYIQSGVIDKHKISDINIRIGEMGAAICEKIKESKVSEVVIEDVQSQGSVSVVVALARLQGFILGWCYENNIKIQIVRPTEWRKAIHFVQGPKVQRKELKKQSADYVKTKYGFDLSEDENEAICISDSFWVKHELENYAAETALDKKEK